MAHEPKFTCTLNITQKLSFTSDEFTSKQAAKKAVADYAVDELFKRDLIVLPSSKPVKLVTKPSPTTNLPSFMTKAPITPAPVKVEPIKKIPPNSIEVSEIVNVDNAVNILMHIAQTEGMKPEFSFNQLSEQVFDCCVKMGPHTLISDSHSNKQAAKKQVACALLQNNFGSYFVPKSFAK